MNWGKCVVFVKNPDGKETIFTGSESDCQLWQAGVKQGLQLAGAEGYTFRMVKPERVASHGEGKSTLITKLATVAGLPIIDIRVTPPKGAK